jgi:hypothetical protein
MAEKPIDPKWTRWHNVVKECPSCGAEPADRVKSRYWRKQAFEHGHGYPPAKFLQPSAVLSQAQGATKLTRAQKDKYLSMDHFHYLPEETKKAVLSDD